MKSQPISRLALFFTSIVLAFLLILWNKDYESEVDSVHPLYSLTETSNFQEFIPDDKYAELPADNLSLNTANTRELEKRVSHEALHEVEALEEAEVKDFEVFSETTIATFKLTEAESSPIPTHIHNVTRSAHAYHMEGSHSEGYHIAIGVDASKVQSEIELNQVSIYYFDRYDTEWKKAHTALVDHQHLRIEAMVPGETDYFAGLIQTPEMPEAAAYVPTVISDIEPANPAAGMRLMQPPSVNRMGTAAINYPLWIPQGRNGMTPQVAVTYNSNASSGWMGMGWNMSSSSISVDTRWGVPKYNSQEESEPYVLDGEELFMQGQKRANRATISGGSVVALSRESGVVRFFPRIMGSYSEIERRGSSPSTYYWIVTDASQTKRYYGCVDTTGVDTNAVLKTTAGNIAQWYLSRVEDKWGNTIDYTYQYFEEGTTTDMKSGGVNRVLKAITYTGFNGSGGYENGKYEVQYHSSNNRPDGKVSMNMGLKQVDDRLLDSVTVYYDSQLLVTYRFNYLTSNKQYFYKTVLTELEEVREGNVFYSHTFDYYNDSLDYSSPQTLSNERFIPWIKPLNDVPGMESISNLIHRSAEPFPLNTSISGGFTVGGTIGGGFSLDQTQDKTFTFSGGLNYGQTWNGTTRTMRDINGDGINDVVYERLDGMFYYRPVTYNSLSGIVEGGRHGLSTSGIERSTSSSFSTNIDFRAVNKVYLGYNWNTSTTHTRRTLTDYNSDGILDMLVYDGTPTPPVLFGALDQYGNWEYSTTSEFTLNPIIKGVSLNIPADDDRIKEFQVTRVWKAPKTGEITITGTASLVTNLNGVARVGIQKNSTNISSGFHTINSTTSKSFNIGASVSKGDLIIFRTISGDDGQEDFVNWDPNIEYSSSFTDGNQSAWSNSSASDGFILSGRNGVFVNGDQDFKLELNLTVSSPLSDDLYIVLQPYKDTIPQAAYIDRVSEGSTIIGTSVLSGLDFYEQFGSFDQETGYSSSDSISFKLSLMSTSNIDWDEIDFRPVVYMESDCAPLNSAYPLVDYETYNEMLSHYGPERVSLTNEVYYEIIPVVPEDSSAIHSIFDWSDEDEEGVVYMTVKSNKDMLSRVAIRFIRDFTNNRIEIHPVQPQDGLPDKGTTLSSTSFNEDPDVIFNGGDVQEEEIWIEFHGAGPAARPMAQYILDNVDSLMLLDAESSSLLVEEPVLNVYYRNIGELNIHHLSWGRFGWSPDGFEEIAEEAIDTSDLHYKALQAVRDSSINYLDSTSVTNNRNTYNPLNYNFFQLTPIRGDVEQGLRSYHEDISTTRGKDRYTVFGSYMAEYRSSNGISPGFIWEDEAAYDTIPSESVDPNYTAKGALGYSRASTASVSWSSGPVSGSTQLVDEDSYYSRSKRMFLDLNGDRYPDVLNENNNTVSIYRTNAFGGHTSSISSFGLTDLVGRSISEGGSVSTGLTLSVKEGTYINGVGFNAKLFFPISFVSTTDVSSSSSLSVSVSMGEGLTRTSFIDINGDGLVDEYLESSDSTSSPPYFNLNKGGGFEQKYFQAEGRVSSSNVSVSAGLGLSTQTITTALDIVEFIETGKFEYSARSWSVGGNMNYSYSNPERAYIDVNGDGLVDYIVYDSNHATSGVTLYLNDGDSYHQYEYVEPNEIAQELGCTNGMGISGNFTGTGAFSFLGLKLKGSFTANGNLGINRLDNSFMDMNGDGIPEYVEQNAFGELKVFYARFANNGKLRTVTNPLGGSFTIHYDSEGQKRGYYDPQVKTHLSDVSNEQIIWDMPQGQVVMKDVVINDGYNITNGTTDLDGSDSAVLRFAYDGGIQSRRERKFLGFTRVATYQEDFTDLLSDYCAEDHAAGVERPRNVDHLYVGTGLTTVSDSTLVKGLTIKNGSIQDYVKPASLSVSDLNEHLYRSQELYRTIAVHVHEWKDSIGVSTTGGEIPDYYDKWNLQYVDLLSESATDHEYRIVETDSTSSSGFGKVDQTGSSWVVVSNFSTIGECATLFPAVTDFTVVDYPVVEDRGHFHAAQKGFQYDEYFNVTQVVDEGTGVATGTDTVVVDTMYHSYYEYFNQLNYCNTTDLTDTVYNDGSVYGLSIACADTTFDDDVVYAMFAPDSCLPDSLIDRQLCTFQEGDTVGSFYTEHRKPQTDTIYIKEVNYNADFTGKLIAVLDYKTPGAVSDQTNALYRHRIYDGTISASNLLRDSRSDFDNNLSPTTVEKFHSTSTWAETDLVYNQYGLIDSIIGPENGTGQRAYRTYTYDNSVHQFVELTTNVYGDSACSHYDFGYQQLLQSVDPNGQPIRYLYDDNRRLSAIWAPRELYYSATGPTVTFSYYPNGKNPGQTGGNIPSAFTYHNAGNDSIFVDYLPTGYCDAIIDVSSLLDTISTPVTTVTFTDGLDQVLQLQTGVDWDDPSDTVHTMTQEIRVSGFVERNKFGLDVRVRNDSVLTNAILGNLESMLTSTVAENTFDYKSRPVQSRSIWSAVDISSNDTLDYLTDSLTYLWYPFDGDTLFAAMSEFESTTRTYEIADGRGRKIATKVQDMSQTDPDIITCFYFDPISQLDSVINPVGQVTSYAYDLFGRVTQEDHPDRGITNTVYDLASNIDSVQTAGTGAYYIDFIYNYNRLIRKEMPDNSKSDSLYHVRYTYGSRGDGRNGAGRIVKVEQGNVLSPLLVNEMRYTEIGQVAETDKTYAVPQEGYRDFVTSSYYDSFGRMLELVYPDGEQVMYKYTSLGNLSSITTRLSGVNGFVIDNISYDGFDNISFIEYGNGTETEYRYHAFTRGLMQSTVDAVKASTLTEMLDRTYEYGDRGMISSVTRDVDVSLATSGSETNHTYHFTYDAFSRLSRGRFEFNDVSTSTDYQVDMTYDEAGSIVSKKSDVVTTSGMIASTLDYDLDYFYNSTKEHQIDTTIENISGDTSLFTYNDMGSIEEVRILNSDTTQYRWNEEQQLVSVKNANGIHHFVYDYNGERIMKSTFTSSTVWKNDTVVEIYNDLAPYKLYVDPYTIESYFSGALQTTKHYYMGMTRVATDISLAEVMEQQQMKTSATTSDNTVDATRNSENGNERSFIDPVIADLQNQLESFDLVQDKDFTQRELKTRPTLAQYYPQYAEASQGKSDLTCCFEGLRYWYHPDYLGSVDMITDDEGKVHQYFLYTPWGEQMYAYTSSNQTYESEYFFNGKEFDEETGLGYYGARYYENQVSSWLSVDPLAMKGKNMSLTPYHFVSNNPIMRVDPDGMWDWLLGKSGTLTRSEENTLYARNADGVVRQIDSEEDILEGEHLVDKVVAEDGTEDYFKSTSMNRTVTAQATEEGSEEILTAEFRSFDKADEADRFMRFAAIHTDVEWAFADIHGSERGLVGTTGEGQHIWLPSYWMGKFDIRSEIHTHNSAKGASVQDMLFVMNKNSAKGVIHAIYDIPSDSYLIYDASTYGEYQLRSRTYNTQQYSRP